MGLILEFTLGPDWRRFFHIVMCKAGKPKWFTDHKRTFYMVDKAKSDYRGEEVLEPDDLVADSQLTFMEGNCKLFTEFLKQEVLKKDEVRIAYFGDEMITDCFYSN